MEELDSHPHEPIATVSLHSPLIRSTFRSGGVAFSPPCVIPRQLVNGRRERDMSRDTRQDDKHVKIVFRQGLAR
jgi:hypothetical protein